MCLDVVLLEVILLGVCGISGICSLMFFISFGNFSVIYSNIMYALFSVSSPSGTLISSMINIFILSHKYLIFFHYFSYF